MFGIESYLFLGIVLGLSAGISPGPLLALVISETLQHHAKEGIKVAMAPLITDAPIILISLFFISTLNKSSLLLAIFSFSGALFLFYLGGQNLRFSGFILPEERRKPQSLFKGIFANLLNPNPYLFWLTIGAPLVIKGYRTNIVFPFFYLFGFYFCLVGSKIVVALLVAKSKNFIRSRFYIFVNKILGLILIIFALLFVKTGMKYLKLI